MSGVSYRLIMLPDSFWGLGSDPAGEAVPFIRDALAIERRLKKGVNLAHERKRYWLCCRRIQDAAQRLVGSMPMEEVGETYYSFLRSSIHQHEGLSTGRLGACFYPPQNLVGSCEDLASHAKFFSQAVTTKGYSSEAEIVKRLAFLNKALAAGAGVVEVPNYLSAASTSSAQITPASHATMAGSAPGTEDEELSPEGRGELLDRFSEIIRKALADQGPVNFSNQPHSIITEALHRFVYRENPDQAAASIRVIYMDGSEAEPFPLRCLDLPKRDEAAVEAPLVRASLVSMRHLAMDEEVDFAWFRNRMVSVPRPHAETDAYCTAETTRLLAEAPATPFKLHLHQTGLETAVVGFYRALVKARIASRDRGATAHCTVVPLYFDKHNEKYTHGEAWR